MSLQITGDFNTALVQSQPRIRRPITGLGCSFRKRSFSRWAKSFVELENIAKDKFDKGTQVAIISAPAGGGAATLPPPYSQKELFHLPDKISNKRETPALVGIDPKQEVRFEYIRGGIFVYDRDKTGVNIFGEPKEAPKDAKDQGIKVDAGDFVHQMKSIRAILVQTEFPVLKQLEEFRQKFLMTSVMEVLKNPRDHPVFVGMIVSRKEKGDPKGWQILYHHDTNKLPMPPEKLPSEVRKPWTVREYLHEIVIDEESPRANAGRIYPNLVTPMPRLASKFVVHKPAKEDAMKKEEKKEIVNVQISKLPKKFRDQLEDKDKEGKDPFRINPLDPLGMLPEDTLYKGPLAAFMPKSDKDKDKEENKENKEEVKLSQTADIPNALIQFLDPDVEPGKTYQYKIEVRMHNPNYGRESEVNFPKLARIRELEPKESEREFVTPEFTVPGEYFYYAVDQAPVNVMFRGADFLPAWYYYVQPNERVMDRATIQIHRYADKITTSIKDSTPRPIGGWVICERLLLRRGEPIGGKEQEQVWTEVPQWDKTLKSFVLKNVPVEKPYLPPLPDEFKKEFKRNFGRDFKPDNHNFGIPIEYMAPQDPKYPGRVPMLVDFEGGKKPRWHVPVKLPPQFWDESAQELLVLNPDLSLTMKSSLADYEIWGSSQEGQESPKDRVEAWRSRVASFKQLTAPAEKKGGILNR